MGNKSKIRSIDQALERFDVLCASVESELESMGSPFSFEEGEEEGEVIATPVPAMGAECVIALDGLEAVTMSWMVRDGEQAAEAAGLDEHGRVAEWLVQMLEGGVAAD